MKKMFFKAVKQEWIETKEMARSIYSHMKGYTLTENQSVTVKIQILDLVKSLFLLGLLLLPTGCFIVAIAIKAFAKFNINVLPTSFNKDKLS
jgi:hypothetical protein